MCGVLFFVCCELLLLHKKNMAKKRGSGGGWNKGMTCKRFVNKKARRGRRGKCAKFSEKQCLERDASGRCIKWSEYHCIRRAHRRCARFKDLMAGVDNPDNMTSEELGNNNHGILALFTGVPNNANDPRPNPPPPSPVNPVPTNSDIDAAIAALSECYNQNELAPVGCKTELAVIRKYMETGNDLEAMRKYYKLMLNRQKQSYTEYQKWNQSGENPEMTRRWLIYAKSLDKMLDELRAVAANHGFVL